MTTIKDVLAVPATGGYYVEDLAALRASSIPVEERYAAKPVTPGFRYVREVAEGVSVGLVLDTGQVAWGDCVAVAYSGKAGRAPVFRTDAGLKTLRQVVAPVLKGRSLDSFRDLAIEVDALTEIVEIERPLPPPEPEISEEGMARRQFLAAPFRFLRSTLGEEEAEAPPVPTERVTVRRALHTAVRYGVSQVLLQAVALSQGVTMAEVIASEWNLPLPNAPVPIHAQSGGERRKNAYKMISRRVASLPHALIDDIPSQLGANGAELSRYTRWLAGRIFELDDKGYRPTIHLDVHGGLGEICQGSLGCVLGHFYSLELAAKPYRLRIECPVLFDSRKEQIEAMKTLRDYVAQKGYNVELVADEWANTLEDIQAFVDAGAADMIQIKMPDLGSVHNAVDAILACKAGGVGAFLGGSCAETDLSARVSVHIALASQPDIIMAKPGMGVDEGIAIVQNEMSRTLAWIQHRNRNLQSAQGA